MVVLWGECKCDMSRKSTLLLRHIFAWFARRYKLSSQKCISRLEQDFRTVSVMVEAGNLVESTDGKQYLSSFYYFLFHS